MNDKQKALKMIPSLDLVLSQSQVIAWAQQFSREWVKETLTPACRRFDESS